MKRFIFLYARWSHTDPSLMSPSTAMSGVLHAVYFFPNLILFYWAELPPAHPMHRGNTGCASKLPRHLG